MNNTDAELLKLRLSRVNELINAVTALKSETHPKVIIKAVARVNNILARIHEAEQKTAPVAPPKGLDHGVLSIPNRTKNIDRDIDKYLAEKAKTDKRTYEDRVFLAKEALKAKKLAEIPIKDQAWAAYKKYGTPLVKKHKDKLDAQGVNPRDFFRDEAKHHPKSFLKMVDLFISESNADSS